MTPDTWVSEETGSVPSQEGAHELPLARMNAMSKAFCPVAELLGLSNDSAGENIVSAMRQARSWLRRLSVQQVHEFVALHPALDAIFGRNAPAFLALQRLTADTLPFASSEYWAAFTAWGC